MAIQYVGGLTASKLGATSGNSTISLTALTGGIASAAAAGDIVIAVFGTGTTVDRTLAINDGTTEYTLIGSELYSNDTFDTSLRVAYKIMGATPDTTVTFGPTGSDEDGGAMAVHVWRGIDTATPLDVTAVTATGINTYLPNAGSITPVTAGAIVIVAGAGGREKDLTGTYAASDLSNFIQNQQTTANGAVIAGVGSFAWTSGAFDPAAWTGSGDTTSFSWAAITLALRPGAAATNSNFFPFF